MRLYLLYFFLTITLSNFSQGFVVRHTLPNSQTQLSKAIFETSPGNYFSGGIMFDTANVSNLCVMGLDNQGQLLWMKKYGSSGFQYLDDLFRTRSFYKKDNFFYYTGSIVDSSSAKYVGVFIKFNLNGDTLWQRLFRDSTEDVVPQMVTQSIDGGFLITGWFQNSINNTVPSLLIKTDASGNELWRRRLNKGVPNVSNGNAIVQDSASKKIVIVGYQYIGTANSWGVYESILVADSLGGVIGQYDYDSSAFGGVLYDIIQTKDKNFVAVGGAIYPQTIGGYNATKSYIVKFDINNPATYLWRINNFDQLSLNNGFLAMEELPNGDLLVGGSYDTLQIHNRPANILTRIAKLTSNGTEVWKKYYDYNLSPGVDNEQFLTDLHLTSDNGWVAAIQGRNPGNNPFLFVKYDSTGCDSSVAYCQMIADGLSKNYFDKSNLSLYPNPSTGLVTIGNSDAGQNASLTLVVLDVSGRELKSYLLNADLQQQSLDLRNLASGIYLISISQGGVPIYKTKFIRD